MYYYYKHKDDTVEPYSVCYEHEDMLSEDELKAKDWVYLGDSLWFNSLPQEIIYLDPNDPRYDLDDDEL